MSYRLHLQRLVGGTPRGPAVPWHSGPTFTADDTLDDAIAAYVELGDVVASVDDATTSILRVEDAGGTESVWRASLRRVVEPS